MRILLGLGEVAGYNHYLKKGFEKLGIPCSLLVEKPHPFKYGSEEGQNVLLQFKTYAANQRMKTSGSFPPVKAFWVLTHRAAQLLLFLWAFLFHDVFIFSFTTSFFQFKELPLLRLFRKKIIYIFHGSDSRPSYLNGSHGLKSDPSAVERILRSINRIKGKLQTIEHHADIIISHPLASHFHQRTFFSLHLLGFPFDSSRVPPSGSFATGKVRILHAPSREDTKGTEVITRMIDRLRAKGHALEFIKISGQPNDIVLSEISKCDFVIDQLYADTPMACFATEAAFFGKPAIVAGYAKEEFSKIFPGGMLPPSHYCLPEEMESGIERLVVDENYRRELGRQVRAYVEKNRRCEVVAERFLKMIRGGFPKEWTYDPKNIRYLYGCGLRRDQVEAMVHAVIQKGTKEALQLSDKPELEELFEKFSENF